MTVPLPAPEHRHLEQPDADEVEAIARGVATAAAGPNGLTEIQRLLAEAIVAAMTGHKVDITTLAPLDAHGLATVLARRDEAFRTRILQVAILCAFVLRPLPEEVVS